MKSLFLLFLIPLTAFAQHKATTVVQIHPSPFLPIPLTESTVKPLKEAGYLKSEHEAIVATETLKIAAIKLYSGKKVDLKTAISELKKRISTKGRHGTDFIEITANAESRKEAAAISTAVANAFIKRRTTAEKKRADKAIKALDAELIAQSELMTKNREALTKLIQKFGIPYFDGPEKLAELETAQDQLEIAKPHQKASILASIKLPKNPVTQPYALYLGTLQKFDHLSQTKPKRNRELVATRKELDKARTELQKVSEKFTIVFQNELKKIGSKEIDLVEQSLRQHNYNQAKEEYEQSRAMLREMKIKQQEARVLLKMPRKPVTIHERAK
jgi:uncharacterized coiled-coil protein SlyX